MAKTMQEIGASTRDAVLDVIKSSPGVESSYIAEKLGRSATAIRKHLVALDESKLIHWTPAHKKFGYLYWPGPPKEEVETDIPITPPRRFEFQPYIPPSSQPPARPGAEDANKVPSRIGDQRIEYHGGRMKGCVCRNINHATGGQHTARFGI